MNHHNALSDAWAQALAIDSSLGIVFMNVFHSTRARQSQSNHLLHPHGIIGETAVGLITHFDALAHAAGFSVTDKGVSGIIPLFGVGGMESPGRWEVGR